MTSAEEVELLRGAGALAIAVDAESLARIGRFIDLLDVWNRRIRLTGDRDRRTLVRKHTVDSLAVVSELPARGIVADIGSGGGFPGLVLGCVRPDLSLRLIESRRRPASFLAEAIRTIPLPGATVLGTRAEDAGRDPAVAGRSDLVVSRAVRLESFLPPTASLVAPGGLVIAMQTPGVEVDYARETGLLYGLELSRHRDYRLPDGEGRRLLVFSRV
jgi:16S rRNA (guanine527-N7)-methyltransferase